MPSAAFSRLGEENAAKRPWRRFPTPVQTGSGSTGASQRSAGDRAPSDGPTLAQSGAAARRELSGMLADPRVTERIPEAPCHSFEPSPPFSCSRRAVPTTDRRAPPHRPAVRAPASAAPARRQEGWEPEPGVRWARQELGPGPAAAPTAARPLRRPCPLSFTLEDYTSGRICSGCAFRSQLVKSPGRARSNA